MLRTSKISLSLQQFWNYYPAGKSELFSPQQMIVLFKKAVLQKAHSRPPPVIKGPPTHDKYIIQMIFPINNVFSQPSRRAWATATPRQHQFRTMISSTQSSSNGPATAFLTWGFPRSTAAGLGRGTAFSRQFSTTKSPCVALFQNNANNGQTNVFSHVSSRIFSPAGSKMNQPDLSDKQAPKHAAVSLAKASNESDENSTVCYDRMFATSINKYDKGIGELICSADESTDDNKFLIRRGSSQQRQHRRRHSLNRRKLDSIIHYDELCHEIMSGNCKRRLRSKHPPDQCHENKNDDSVHYHLLITLDAMQFWEEGGPLIESIEKMTSRYQTHINGVLKLLDYLQKRGTFKATLIRGQLHINLPILIQSKQQAIDFLYSAGILNSAYEKQALFKVVAENDPVSPDKNRPSLDSSGVVGPDYFKDLQLFLDHADYLIETSAAFNRRQ